MRSIKIKWFSIPLLIRAALLTSFLWLPLQYKLFRLINLDNLLEDSYETLLVPKQNSSEKRYRDDIKAIQKGEQEGKQKYEHEVKQHTMMLKKSTKTQEGKTQQAEHYVNPMLGKSTKTPEGKPHQAEHYVNPTENSLFSVYREIYILGVHHSATSIISKALLSMGAYGGERRDVLLADKTKSWEKNYKFFEQADLVELNDKVYQWCGVTDNQGHGPLWVGWGLDCSQMQPSDLQEFRTQANQLLSKYRLGCKDHKASSMALKDPRLALTFPLWRQVLNQPFVCVIVYRTPLSVARGVSLWANEDLATEDYVKIWANTTINMLQGCSGFPIAIIRQMELQPNAYVALKHLQNALTELGVPGLALPSMGSKKDPTKHLRPPPQRGDLQEALKTPYAFTRSELELIHIMEMFPRKSKYSKDQMQKILQPVTSSLKVKRESKGSLIHLLGWCPTEEAPCEFSLRQLRALESLLFHNPGCSIMIYTNQDMAIPDQIQPLLTLHFPIRLVSYSSVLDEAMKNPLVADMAKFLKDTSLVDSPLLWKLFLLFWYGGIAIDLGVLCLRSLKGIPDNAIGYLHPFGRLSLMLKFNQPQNQVLHELLVLMLTPGTAHTGNVFDVLLEKSTSFPGEMVHVLHTVFAPYTLSNIGLSCFQQSNDNSQLSLENVFLLDLFDDIVGSKEIHYGSTCQSWLRGTCILCDEGLDIAIQTGVKRSTSIFVNLPQPTPQDLIHLVWTTEAKSFSPWRKRVLESIFLHNPNAQVTYHSNTIYQAMFDEFVAGGYSLNIAPLSCREMLKNTPLEDWYFQVNEWKKGPFFYSHITDGLRLAFLWKYGGLYMDSDFVVLGNLTALPSMLASQGAPKFDMNGAFMKMSPGHPYLALAMEAFVQRYRHGCVKGKWRLCYSLNWNIVGPDLITASTFDYLSLTDSLVLNLAESDGTPKTAAEGRRHSQHPFALHVYPWQAIYPIPWNQAELPHFSLPFKASMKHVKAMEARFESLAMHMWSNRNRYRGIPPFSFGDLILQKHSIFPSTSERSPEQWSKSMRSKLFVIYTTRSENPSDSDSRSIKSLCDNFTPIHLVVAWKLNYSPVECGGPSGFSLGTKVAYKFKVNQDPLAHASDALSQCLKDKVMISPFKYVMLLGEGLKVTQETNLEWSIDILENDDSVDAIGGVPFEGSKVPFSKLYKYHEIPCKDSSNKKCYCEKNIDATGLQKTSSLKFPFVVGRIKAMLSDLKKQGESNLYIMPELRAAASSLIPFPKKVKKCKTNFDPLGSYRSIVKLEPG